MSITTYEDEPQSEAEDISILGDVIVEQESAKREDAKLATGLVSVFNQIDRLVNLMRVYPNHHPLVDTLGLQVLLRITELLKEHSLIHIDLHATKLTTEAGTLCYNRELSDRDEFLWYDSYSDGLVWLEFREGLEYGELMDVIRVLERVNRGNVSDDEDAITMLWDLDMENIAFDALEGFMGNDLIESFACTEAEAVDIVVDTMIEPEGEHADKLHDMFANPMPPKSVDIFTRMQIDAGHKLQMPKLSDNDLSYAFGIDESVVDGLHEEWSSGINLEYRLIETLISVIRTAPQSEAAAHAGELIQKVTLELLEKDLIDNVVTILELLHARRRFLEKTAVDPLHELIATLTDPTQIEALLNLFSKARDRRESLHRLFHALDPTKVQLQLQRKLSQDAEIEGEELLLEMLLDLSQDDAERALASGEFLKQTPYLRRILRMMRTRDVAEWQSAPHILRAGIASDDAEVREAALEVKHPVWESDRGATQLLQPLTEDAEVDVRRKAFKLLAEFHQPRFMETIEDVVVSRTFGSRSRAEVRFLMRTFLETSSSAPETLRSLLDVRGWIGADKREFAELAAKCLVEQGDEEALEIVKSQADSIWVFPALKKSYRELLKLHDHMEPEEGDA